MKMFTIIFTFYMLALSCLPCNDVDVCETNTTVTNHNNHKQHKNTTDNCTPFCVCSCCAVGLYVPPILHYSVVQQIFPAIKYPSYNSYYTNAILVAIWQPPKFC